MNTHPVRPVSSNRFAFAGRSPRSLFVVLALVLTGLVLPSSALALTGPVWTTQSSGLTDDFSAVAYGNGTFVAVGWDATVATSPDGITWTPRETGVTGNWYDITFGNGIFVAVGETGDGVSMTSPNGVTWTPTTATDTFGRSAHPTTRRGFAAFRAVEYGNGTFVAFDESGAPFTSLDGATWVRAVIVQPPGDLARRAHTRVQYFNSWLAYGNKRFVVVRNNGETLTSTDGSNWDVAAPVPGNCTSMMGIAFGVGLFTAANMDNEVVTSPDAAAWTLTRGSEYECSANTVRAPALGLIMTAVGFGSGTFVTVAQNNSGVLETSWSSDAATWTSTLMPIFLPKHGRAPIRAVRKYRSYVTDIAYGNGEFVGVGDQGTVITAPAASGTLTVATRGAGTGTVTTTTPGIDCGAVCSAPFRYTSAVTLNATAAAGSVFTGWSGACTGADTTCTVTIGDTTSVTATFATVAPQASVVPLTLRTPAASASSMSITSSGASITVPVTCTSANATLLNSCTVTFSSPRAATQSPAGLEIAGKAATRVTVGRGTGHSTAGKKSLTISVTLNARGRQALKRVLKLATTMTATASSASGTSATSSARATLRLPSHAILPTDGIFASNSWTLDTAGVSYVARLWRLLPPRVKHLSCTGYTDNTGPPLDNVWIGQQRAAAVCTALEAAGLRATHTMVTSQGAGDPRATNATAAGRALNRRVAVTITY